MKILMLTWEFPPFISGGLGMACYGLFKGLLDIGIQLDMLLPTSEEVFFPLRQTADSDSLPAAFLDATRQAQGAPTIEGELRQRLVQLGLMTLPESYTTPALFERVLAQIETGATTHPLPGIEELSLHMNGEEDLFRRVRAYAARAAKFASAIECDAIHAHDWLTYPAGIILKHILGKPLIAHIHATEFDRAGGPGDERIHKIEYAGLMAADQIIAVSQYTAQMICDRYRIPMEKVRVVHNAHTLPGKPRARHRLFRDPIVLLLGRVTLQKGPDYFLDVAARVLARHERVRFVLAGSGDMFSRILHGAAARRLKDRFLATGFLDRDQVDALLATTDILMLPSISEPFGIVPLEAMASGAVAIVSKQSGVAEVISNAYKINFWDVEEMADTIVHLLEHPEERERVALAGQQEAMAIEWHRAAEKTHEAYRELLCCT